MLWRTPCSRDAEFAARPPPKSFPPVEERVPARYFPPVRCRARRIGEVRRELGTRNREKPRGNTWIDERQAASFSPAHPWAPAALHLALGPSLPAAGSSAHPPPFQLPAHPHPSCSSVSPHATRQIWPPLCLSCWLHVSASPSGCWIYSSPPKTKVSC